MGKYLSVLLSALVLAVLTFLVHTEAGAVADGNGSCLQSELDNKDCGNLGSNVIEFLGTGAATCNTINFGAVPCTAYFYRYTGGATNQLNLAIPKKVMTKFTSESDAAVVGCTNLYTNGQGDPTTGFGKNQLTVNVCRIAPTLTSFPSAPPGTNIRIQADPSSFDPLSWQLKVGNSTTAAAINGPGIPGAPVAETAKTLETASGGSCSYTIVGGEPTLVNCPTGRILPLVQTKLCLPTTGNQVPTFTNNSGSFTCESVDFETEGCITKTTGSDPCITSGGRRVCY